MSAAVGFRGMLAGVEYDDPALFEQTAAALGYLGMGRRSREDWAVGVPVRVTLNDGGAVDGQVWCRAEQHGWVWVALDTGAYVAVSTRSGVVRDQAGDRGAQIGRIAGERAA